MKAAKTVTKTRAFDVANHLRTREEQAAYLNAWLEDAPDDVAGISRALGDLARARGMAKVADDTGLSRESLYKALSAKGNPSLATFLKVCLALDLSMHVDAMVLETRSAAKAALKDSAAQLRKMIRVTQRPRTHGRGHPEAHGDEKAPRHARRGEMSPLQASRKEEETNQTNS